MAAFIIGAKILINYKRAIEDFANFAKMFLNFINWNPSPEIFTIPGIDWPVRWYGLMWALAFIASHFFMNRIFKAEGRSEKALDTLTLYIILGTVLGARIGHCLFYGPWFDEELANGVIIEGYLSHPLNILKVYEGGLASHGGALGILTAMILYCRKEKESWIWLFDRLVVVVPLAAMCIRLGNLINSEIVGKVTNVPWAFIFSNNDDDKYNLVKYNIPVPPRHPAQLYEAIFCFFLFILMYWLWKNKRDKVGPGFMFGVMCVLLFIERFLVEFLKENQAEFEGSMALNMGQWLSIPFILIGAFMIWRANKIKAKEIS
ncbi:MAG: prolipoprotein diacylglyceryl transferase [Bacteroidota bacterium]|nr:prolipoprotein diacylglyceryl transferase [Bacteroidota bacterium]